MSLTLQAYSEITQKYVSSLIAGVHLCIYLFIYSTGRDDRSDGRIVCRGPHPALNTAMLHEREQLAMTNLSDTHAHTRTKTHAHTLKG